MSVIGLTFPESFQRFYPHMTLLQTGDDVYALIPPNQLDWIFTIKHEHEDIWHVYGEKQEGDIFDMRYRMGVTGIQELIDY